MISLILFKKKKIGRTLCHWSRFRENLKLYIDMKIVFILH